MQLLTRRPLWSVVIGALMATPALAQTPPLSSYVAKVETLELEFTPLETNFRRECAPFIALVALVKSDFDRMDETGRDTLLQDLDPALESCIQPLMAYGAGLNQLSEGYLGINEALAKQMAQIDDATTRQTMQDFAVQMTGKIDANSIKLNDAIQATTLPDHIFK